MPSCPVCGTAYPKGTGFCSLDGTSLGAPPAPQAPPPLLQDTDPSCKTVAPEEPPSLSDTYEEVPDLLLEESIYSASDLAPVSHPASSPTQMVLVREGKFLPPIGEEPDTQPLLQAVSLRELSDEPVWEKTDLPPQEGDLQRGFYSASDLVVVAPPNENASKPAPPKPTPPKSSPPPPPPAASLHPSGPPQKPANTDAKITRDAARPQVSAPPASRPDPRLGSLVCGYRLEKRLGTGGMGTVYEALQPATGEKVAIKLLSPHHAHHQEALWRLFNEARAAHQIQHPHIIRVWDVGVLPDQTGYLIMELLEGYNLGDLLEERGSLSLPECNNILLPVCEALEAAHAKGIVHRDLKPENIFLCRQSKSNHLVKLLDFGIAKLSQTAQRDNTFRTQAGAVLGTPAYMPPEQATGKTDLDARADIYSLGVLLYRCLTGDLPFRGRTSVDVMLKQLYETPLPVRERAPERQIPPPVDAIILRCLEKDPVRRPSIQEVLQALRDPTLFPPEKPRKPQPSDKSPRPGKLLLKKE